MEKNQRVAVNKGKAPPGECIDIKQAPTSPFVLDFIVQGEKTGDNFYRYDAVRYNCQDWQRRLLNASGIHEADSFISQNTQELLTPAVGAIARATTDIAGLADYVMKGGKK